MNDGDYRTNKKTAGRGLRSFCSIRVAGNVVYDVAIVARGRGDNAHQHALLSDQFIIGWKVEMNPV